MQQFFLLSLGQYRPVLSNSAYKELSFHSILDTCLHLNKLRNQQLIKEMKSQGSLLPPNWKFRQANTESDNISAQKGKKPLCGPVTEHENLHLVACQSSMWTSLRVKFPRLYHWRSPQLEDFNLHYSKKDISSKFKKKFHLLSTGKRQRLHF